MDKAGERRSEAETASSEAQPIRLGRSAQPQSLTVAGECRAHRRRRREVTAGDDRLRERRQERQQTVERALVQRGVGSERELVRAPLELLVATDDRRA